MALANLLKNGTYSRIENSSIDKINKNVQFVLTVYDNNNNSLTRVAQMYFSFAVQLVPMDFQQVGSIPPPTPSGPPQTQEEAEEIMKNAPPHWHWYLVPGDASGEWEQFRCKIVMYDLSKLSWVEIPRSEVIRRFNQEYFICNENGVWEKNYMAFTLEDWDKYFSSSVMETSNLHKQIYLFLKQYLKIDNITDV